MPVSSKRLGLIELMTGGSYHELALCPPDRTYVVREYAVHNGSSAARSVAIVVRTATQGDYRVATLPVPVGTTAVPQFLRAHVLHPGDRLMVLCDGTVGTQYNVSAYVSGASLFGSPPQA